MRLQIDTERKTIKLESGVNIGDFIKAIKTMLPDWKDYDIETNCVVEWRDPIPFYPMNPHRPWWNSPYKITCGPIGPLSSALQAKDILGDASYTPTGEYQIEVISHP